MLSFYSWSSSILKSPKRDYPVESLREDFQMLKETLEIAVKERGRGFDVQIVNA